MLYYFSAGFLTFKQSDFTSCLSTDRSLLRLECRVAARVRLGAASDTWNPSCVAEAQMRTGILVLSRSIGLVGEMLYYFSAGFLTFKQSDFTSCLSTDRSLLRLECRVAARVRLGAGPDTWNPSCVAEAQMRTGILVLSRSIGLVKI